MYMLHTQYTHLHVRNTHTHTSSHGTSGTSVSLRDAISCFRDNGTKALSHCQPKILHNQQRLSYPESPGEQSAQTVLTRTPLLPLSAKVSVELALLQ